MGTTQTKNKEKNEIIVNNNTGSNTNNINEINYLEIIIIIIVIVLIQVIIHFLKKYFAKIVNREVKRIDI